MGKVKSKRLITGKIKGGSLKEGIKFENIDWEKAERIFKEDKNLIEETLRKATNRYPYLKEVLVLLAAGSFLSLSILIPNLPMAVAPFVKKWQRYDKRRLRQTLKRLKERKLVEVVETKDGPVVRITKQGMIKTLKYKLEKMKIKEPKSWDKKWRVIIFDVPENKKQMRNFFREKLKALNFYLLQKSVWIYPFPCFDEIEFLRQIYMIGGSVTYIIAEKIEGEEKLLSYYRLVK